MVIVSAIAKKLNLPGKTQCFTMNLEKDMNRQSVIEKHYPENIRTEVFRTLMNEPIDGIPKINSVREEPGGWVVTEEYIQGRTFAEVLQGGLFNKKTAVNYCLKLCNILEQLHAKGIVHGDIKPENIILGNDGKMWLIDFDASHFVKDAVGRDTVMLGTPGYASPEQFGFGRSDPRSDIYAIGVLLNIMMTGKHPIYQTIPGRLSIVVEKCTDVDPERRYQNIKELKQGLRHPRRRHEFLPVGFRSMNPIKMILAMLGYGAWIMMAVAITIPDRERDAKAFMFFRGWLIAAFIGTIFIFFNYGGINNIFSKKKNSRHIAAKIVETFIFLIVITLIVFIWGSMVNAW